MAWDDDPYDTSYPSQQRRESTPLEDIFASLFAGMPTNPAAYVAEQKRLDQQRREERNTGRDALDPYIGASDPRTMGRVRGSPAGGLPVQADEASPFALTRERIKDELDNNAGLRRAFDASTTAEVGTDPAKRRWYQALTIDRAVQTGKPLLEVVNNPDYYPSSTTNKSATTGMGTDPSLWEGANPANFATGNASRDPRTGRDVGFAGGPQTSSFGAERGGIEGQSGLPYARAMGYTGPSTSAIGFGPNAPQGNDLAGLTPGTSPENYGSVASLNGRRRMDDTQPPGLLSMFGGGRQQNLDGRPQGLLGALDPEMMGYLAMMVKGASPGSSLDPEGMLKLAQARRSSEQDMLLRQQQFKLNERAQDRADLDADRPQYITRPDGSIVAVPRRGGEPTIITPGVKNLEETAKQKDYAFARQNGFKGTFEEWNAQNSMTPEKSQDAIIGKKLGEEQIEIQKQGFNASSQIAQLNQMEKLMETPGFRSGTGAGFQQALQKAWVAIGGDPKAPASVEAFNALAAKSVVEDLGSLGTGISNADRDYLSRTAATIENTPEGNRQIIAVKRELAQRKKDMALLARDYAKSHNGRLDVGFYQAAEDYAEKNPMFKDVPAPGGGGTTAAPGGSGGSGGSVPGGTSKYRDGQTATGPGGQKLIYREGQGWVPQ